MTETQKTAREPLPRGFWIIWSTVALDMIGFGMVAPILGRYADRFGASGFQVGMLFASFSLAQMIFAPILGRWSDRIGRKPVIVRVVGDFACGDYVIRSHYSPCLERITSFWIFTNPGLRSGTS